MILGKGESLIGELKSCLLNELQTIPYLLRHHLFGMEDHSRTAVVLQQNGRTIDTLNLKHICSSSIYSLN